MGIDQIGSPRRLAVFLDRDGVLNRAVVRDGKPYPPSSVEDLEILPGVPEALEHLKRAGFLLLVVTNQPDVGSGKQSREVVEALHANLQAGLPLDAIFVCYHVDADACTCRKPAPGMLQQAAARFGLYLPGCYMVGDRWRDVDAGHRAGCRTILLDYGYRERAADNEPAANVTSLMEAAGWILQDAAERCVDEITHGT
jgi:D-glycero-D-manno-heptose 1,7-bisphosphate phosphatase